MFASRSRKEKQACVRTFDVPIADDPVPQSPVDRPPTRVDPEHHSRWDRLRGLSLRTSGVGEKRYAARTSRELRGHRASCILRLTSQAAICTGWSHGTCPMRCSRATPYWKSRGGFAPGLEIAKLTLGDSCTICIAISGLHHESMDPRDVGECASQIPHECRAVTSQPRRKLSTTSTREGHCIRVRVALQGFVFPRN